VRGVRLVLTGPKIPARVGVKTVASEAIKTRARVTMRSTTKAVWKTVEKLPRTKDKSHTTMAYTLPPWNVLLLLAGRGDGQMMAMSSPEPMARLLRLGFAHILK
jgi:hypothetical protein